MSMTYKEWCDQYYFITAQEVVPEGKIEVVKHSLRKWIGIKQALSSGEASVMSGTLMFANDDSAFTPDSSTCSLCEYADAKSVEARAKGSRDEDICRHCPIVEVRGSSCSGYNSEWYAWAQHEDPKPMVKLLQHVLKTLEDQAAYKTKNSKPTPYRPTCDLYPG